MPANESMDELTIIRERSLVIRLEVEHSPIISDEPFLSFDLVEPIVKKYGTEYMEALMHDAAGYSLSRQVFATSTEANSCILAVAKTGRTKCWTETGGRPIPDGYIFGRTSINFVVPAVKPTCRNYYADDESVLVNNWFLRAYSLRRRLRTANMDCRFMIDETRNLVVLHAQVATTKDTKD